MQPNRQEAETNPQADRIFTTESTEIHGKRIELPVRRGPAPGPREAGRPACVPDLPAISRRSSSPFPYSSVWSVVQSGLCFECLVEERRRGPLVGTQLVK